MLGETRLSEEKAKKAMIDAARLADELRGEQDLAQRLERDRRTIDLQVKDVQTKLDEAEQISLKNGRKVMQRLEQRVKELEVNLDAEQRKLVDAQKNSRRIDRRVNELTFQQDEDAKNRERMQELIDKLQNKVSWQVTGYRLNPHTFLSIRSSPTRDRLRRPRRLPPSTWPNSGRFRASSSRLRSAPTSTSRSCPSTRPGDAPCRLARLKRLPH